MTKVVPASPSISCQVGETTIGGASSIAAVANSLYVQRVALQDCMVSGLMFFCNAASGNVMSSLFDARGNLIAQSASQPAAALNVVPFVTPVAPGGDFYYMGMQFSGTPTFWGGSLLLPTAIIAQGGFTVPSSILSSFPIGLSGTANVHMSTY